VLLGPCLTWLKENKKVCNMVFKLNMRNEFCVCSLLLE
jgi:hypothetical protein